MPLRALSRGHGIRRVVPKSIEHVWITDDVLADAFNHFFRISPSNCKRYGSNVPGPLEARRRLAKRNHAALSAHGSFGSPFPPILEMFGAPDQPAFSWRYEPPGVPKESVQPSYSPYSPPPEWMSAFQLEDPVESFEQQLPYIENLKQLKELLFEEGLGPRLDEETSRKVFAQLIEAKAPIEMLFEFVRDGNLDQSREQNFMVLLKHLSAHKLERKHVDDLLLTASAVQARLIFSPRHFRIIASKTFDMTEAPSANAAARSQAYLRSRLYGQMWEALSKQNESSDESLLEFSYRLLRKLCLQHRLRFPVQTASSVGADAFHPMLTTWVIDLTQKIATEEAYESVLVEALMIFPQAFTQSWIENVTKILSQRCASDGACAQALFGWIKVLQKCIDGSFDTSASCQRIDMARHYEQMAQELEPVLLWKLFSHLGPRKTGPILMRHWIPRFLKSERPSDNLALALVLQDFHCSRRLRDSAGSDMWDLVAIMAAIHNRLKYRAKRVWMTLVEVIYVSYGPDRLLEFLSLCRREGVRFKHSISPLINIFREVTEKDPQMALNMFRAERSLHLTHSPWLPIELIKSRHVPDRDILWILGRMDEHVPRRLLPNGMTIRSLTKSRIELINAIAFAIASDRFRTATQSFRTLWLLHRYLREHHVELAPEFVHCMVYAGATRPLQQKAWVPLSKIRFLVELIRKTEGEGAAVAFERDMWKWRGEVMHEAVVKVAKAGYGRQPRYVSFAKAKGLL